MRNIYSLVAVWSKVCDQRGGKSMGAYRVARWQSQVLSDRNPYIPFSGPKGFLP